LIISNAIVGAAICRPPSQDNEPTFSGGYGIRPYGVRLTTDVIVGRGLAPAVVADVGKREIAWSTIIVNVGGGNLPPAIAG